MLLVGGGLFFAVVYWLLVAVVAGFAARCLMVFLPVGVCCAGG